MTRWRDREKASARCVFAQPMADIVAMALSRVSFSPIGATYGHIGLRQ